ncbi:MAG: cyclic nucleotide-binding domain-containing protein, partial [Planctomycetaceae bacterium]
MANITPAELQNVELLSGFQPEELEQFAAALEVREFSEGENMIAGGDETRALFLILSGQVEIELTSFIEETVLLATLG